MGIQIDIRVIDFVVLLGDTKILESIVELEPVIVLNGPIVNQPI